MCCRSCYDVTTFNFYVFPQQLFSVDRRFHCQSGSLRFLASHNFDFNQVRLSSPSMCRKGDATHTTIFVMFIASKRQPSRECDHIYFSSDDLSRHSIP